MLKIELKKVVDPTTKDFKRTQQLMKCLKKTDRFNGGLRLLKEQATGDNVVMCLRVEPLKICNVVNTTQADYNKTKDHILDYFDALGLQLDDWRVRSISYCCNLIVPDIGKRAIMVSQLQDAALQQSECDVWAHNAYDNEVQGLIKRLQSQGNTTRPRPWEKDVLCISNTVSKGRVTEMSNQLGVKPTWDYWVTANMEQFFLDEAARALLGSGATIDTDRPWQCLADMLVSDGQKTA